MQFHCDDPFSAVSRVIDLARRLDLPFAQLSYTKGDDGQFILHLELDETTADRARDFAARLGQIGGLRIGEPDA